MLELYKGQLSRQDIEYNLSYRELLLYRDVRYERLTKEREAMEAERKKQENK